MGRTVKVKICNGQLQVWDDSPEYEFGQVWMTICVWCHNGPLEPSLSPVCGECEAVIEDN